jgi:DNA (cytosine-5)-methyltransferase 1
MDTIELFAGGGGLALGLHQAGFHPVAVIERDPDSCKTLRENWHRTMGIDLRLFNQDVRQVNLAEWEDRLDLISGGPPCQPFSIGGKHRGHHDERDMFPHAVRVVRTVRPKAFIFENVRGLLRKSFAKYFGYVLLQLQYPEIERRDDQSWAEHLAALEEHHTTGADHGLRYRVVFQKVNAANFGVPQHRERVVIVGFRYDIKEPWSFPLPTHSADALLAAKWINGSYWEEHQITRADRPTLPPNLRRDLNRIETLPFTARWRTVRDALQGLPDPRSHHAALIPNHRFQPGARRYPGHTGSELDWPGKTLKAGGRIGPFQSPQQAQSRREHRRQTAQSTSRGTSTSPLPRSRHIPDLLHRNVPALREDCPRKSGCAVRATDLCGQSHPPGWAQRPRRLRCRSRLRPHSVDTRLMSLV